LEITTSCIIKEKYKEGGTTWTDTFVMCVDTFTIQPSVMTLKELLREQRLKTYQLVGFAQNVALALKASRKSKQKLC
jgi:hypothetical protein